MSVPVVQPDKVQFQQIALADKTVNVDEESDCSFQIINMGQTKLSNGTVKLVDSKGKELNSAYVGNIEAGGQFASNYTLPVTFDKTGEYKLKLIFEYENENMDKKSIEQEFKVKVENQLTRLTTSMTVQIIQITVKNKTTTAQQKLKSTLDAVWVQQ